MQNIQIFYAGPIMFAVICCCMSSFDVFLYWFFSISYFYIFFYYFYIFFLYYTILYILCLFLQSLFVIFIMLLSILFSTLLIVTILCFFFQSFLYFCSKKYFHHTFCNNKKEKPFFYSMSSFIKQNLYITKLV